MTIFMRNFGEGSAKVLSDDLFCDLSMAFVDNHATLKRIKTLEGASLYQPDNAIRSDRLRHHGKIKQFVGDVRRDVIAAVLQSRVEDMKPLARIPGKDDEGIPSKKLPMVTEENSGEIFSEKTRILESLLQRFDKEIERVSKQRNISFDGHSRG